MLFLVVLHLKLVIWYWVWLVYWLYPHLVVVLWYDWFVQILLWFVCPII